MPLSIAYSKNQSGFSPRFKPSRPLSRDAEQAKTASPQEGTPASILRTGQRPAIDSTNTGTAQITAALTIYLSKLGDGHRSAAGDSANRPARASQTRSSSDASADQAASSADDENTVAEPEPLDAGALLRALDAYALS